MPNLGFKLMTHTALLFVRTSLLAILLASAAMPAAAQDSFSSLEERMTGKEFKQTGLHKLSEDELADSMPGFRPDRWPRAKLPTQTVSRPGLQWILMKRTRPTGAA